MSNEEPNYPDLKCITCHEEITFENDGMIINEGESSQCCICEFCHFQEFGVLIYPALLYFMNKPIIEEPKPTY